MNNTRCFKVKNLPYCSTMGSTVWMCVTVLIDTLVPSSALVTQLCKISPFSLYVHTYRTIEALLCCFCCRNPCAIMYVLARLAECGDAAKRMAVLSLCISWEKHGLNTVCYCYDLWVRYCTVRYVLNLLKTKRNLLYIRNQFVPRSKHFPPLL